MTAETRKVIRVPKPDCPTCAGSGTERTETAPGEWTFGPCGYCGGALVAHIDARPPHAVRYTEGGRGNA